MAQNSTTVCPVDFDPFGTDYLRDPYPILAEMRSDGAVKYSPDLDMWVITRYGDVDTVFRDSVTYSASIAQDPIRPLHPDAVAILAEGFRPIRTMSNLDGPEHTRIRRHNMVGFSPKRIKSMEPVVRDAATKLIGNFPTSGEFDIVEALTFPLPASIIFTLLGFPDDDTEMLKGWCGDRMSFSWGRPDRESQVQIAADMVAYWQYCEAHIETQLVRPGDNFTGDLLRIHLDDPTTLSIHEVTHIVYGLSFAGHETTTNLLSNTIRRLLENRSAWESMLGDPDTIPDIVQEGLRHDSSVLAWRRITTKETTLGDTLLPKGAKLLLMLGAANRDPAVFEDPDRFDPTRDNAGEHRSFGWGKHFCLGAALTRLEVTVVLEELARLRPDLYLADQDMSFHPNVSFRGPGRLLLTVGSSQPDDGS